MQQRPPSRDQLLLRLGAAKTEAGRAFQLVQLHLPKPGEAVTRQTFGFRLDKTKFQQAELRDGAMSPKQMDRKAPRRPHGKLPQRGQSSRTISQR